MYIFGKKKDTFTLDEKTIIELLDKAKKKSLSFSEIKILDIINTFEALSKLWCKGSEYYKRALVLLEKEGHFSKELNEITLSLLPALLSKESLLKRVRAEVGDEKGLDSFIEKEGYKGHIHYNPLGVLLHVTAGNVFLGAIDSIILGCLSKNISLVKLSSQNTALPFLFFESLIEIDSKNILKDKVSLLFWKGGDKRVESQIKNGVDGIIAWGGEEMVRSYRQDLSHRVRFIEHGPRVSFQVISKKFYDSMTVEDYKALAQDICMWDQQACANSQNIFIESGIECESFMSKLSRSLEAFHIKPKELSGDEAVERLKEKEKALMLEFKTKQKAFIKKNSVVSFDSSPYLSPTALNRSVVVKNYNVLDELCLRFSGFGHYMQTCGLGVSVSERPKYLKKLSLAGVDRFTRVGKMLTGLDGSPHDGSFSIIELMRIVCDEFIESPCEFAMRSVSDIPFYDGLKLKSFEDLPLISGKTLAENSFGPQSKFINKKAKDGIVFSSGGTTGKPKYCFYTMKEFENISKLLAKSYKRLGLAPQSRVANLFVAGNMWSSFSAIQQALGACNVVQFPMGGLFGHRDFESIAKTFEIDVLFGLPGLILEIANGCPDLKIKQIFYAGESFSQSALDFIEETWGCVEIHSAGYACVDVGPIGYQDETCSMGEHILFDEFLHLEVIEEEAIITSKLRINQPVIRYKTGDKIELVSHDSQTRFKLRQRVDGKVSIWSSRFNLEDIKKALASVNIKEDFQLELHTVVEDKSYKDTLQLNISRPITPKGDELSKLLEAIFEHCEDIRKTVSFGFFERHTSISNQMLRNEKTGKTKKVFDFR